MDCQTERSRSFDKYGHISTPLNLTCIVFIDAPMIRYFCFFLFTLVVASCGGNKKGTNAEEFVANPNASEKPVGADAITLGETLVKSNDCSACHHKINAIIGPAHMEVAKKYEFTEDNVKLLAGKIMKGGLGVWGQIPMAAHVDITQDEADAMARYVLSLDGEKEH